MTKNGIDSKPSETALFAALRRAIAYQDYNDEKFGPDYLASSFLPVHFRFFLKFICKCFSIANTTELGMKKLCITQWRIAGNIF